MGPETELTGENAAQVTSQASQDMTDIAEDMASKGIPITTGRIKKPSMIDQARDYISEKAPSISFKELNPFKNFHPIDAINEKRQNWANSRALKAEEKQRLQEEKEAQEAIAHEKNLQTSYKDIRIIPEANNINTPYITDLDKKFNNDIPVFTDYNQPTTSKALEPKTEQVTGINTKNEYTHLTPEGEFVGPLKPKESDTDVLLLDDIIAEPETAAPIEELQNKEKSQKKGKQVINLQIPIPIPEELAIKHVEEENRDTEYIADQPYRSTNKNSQRMIWTGLHSGFPPVICLDGKQKKPNHSEEFPAQAYRVTEKACSLLFGAKERTLDTINSAVTNVKNAYANTANKLKNIVPESQPQPEPTTADNEEIFSDFTETYETFRNAIETTTKNEATNTEVTTKLAVEVEKTARPISIEDTDVIAVTEDDILLLEESQIIKTPEETASYQQSNNTGSYKLGFGETYLSIAKMIKEAEGYDASIPSLATQVAYKSTPQNVELENIVDIDIDTTKKPLEKARSMLSQTNYNSMDSEKQAEIRQNVTEHLYFLCEKADQNPRLETLEEITSIAEEFRGIIPQTAADIKMHLLNYK